MPFFSIAGSSSIAHYYTLEELNPTRSNGKREVKKNAHLL